MKSVREDWLGHSAQIVREVKLYLCARLWVVTVDFMLVTLVRKNLYGLKLFTCWQREENTTINPWLWTRATGRREHAAQTRRKHQGQPGGRRKLGLSLFSGWIFQWLQKIFVKMSIEELQGGCQHIPSNIIRDAVTYCKPCSSWTQNTCFEVKDWQNQWISSGGKTGR